MNHDLKLESIIFNVDAVTAVARITINRQAQLNALNQNVLLELEMVCDELTRNPVVRVVTIEGAGEKAFVAGADIAEMSNLSSAQAQIFAELGQRVTTKIENLPQIVVAKINGFALGGGCELAMAADILVATRASKFGQPEVNLGLIPGFGGTQRLVKRVGLPIALDMICTGRGRMLTADEALASGLISRVVENKEALDQATESIVSAILKADSNAVKLAKKITRSSYDMTLDAGLKAESYGFSGLFSSAETKKRIEDFLKK